MKSIPEFSYAPASTSGKRLHRYFLSVAFERHRRCKPCSRSALCSASLGIAGKQRSGRRSEKLSVPGPHPLLFYIHMPPLRRVSQADLEWVSSPIFSPSCSCRFRPFLLLERGYELRCVHVIVVITSWTPCPPRPRRSRRCRTRCRPSSTPCRLHTYIHTHGAAVSQPQDDEHL